jgi:hypothetical protein
MILYVDAIFFRQALQDVARDPHFVGGFLGALPKIWNSHWPLATSALMPSCGRRLERCRVLLDNLASNITNILGSQHLYSKALEELDSRSRGSQAAGRFYRRSILAQIRTPRQHRREWWHGHSWGEE